MSFVRSIRATRPKNYCNAVAIYCEMGLFSAQVWVPNREDNTLSRIDPATNRVVETVDVGTSPFVVPDHRSELWIGSWGGGDVWRLAPSP
jgi:YVTN family beta-propeller protein